MKKPKAENKFPEDLAKLYQLRGIVEAKLRRLNVTITKVQNQQARWPERTENPSDSQ